MNVEQIRAQIKEIRHLTKQYGQLIKERTLTFPVVNEIIDFYEADGESEAIKDADERIAEMQGRLSKAQGAAGGLTRRINRLEKENAELTNIKRNNAKLARVSSFAFELLEYLNKPANKQLDVQGDLLQDNPLYVRLFEELAVGIDEGE